MADYYTTLGVARNATGSAIKKAYHKLAQMWHPDNPIPSGFTKKQQTEKFQEISAVYAVLSDPEKRKLYDQHGDGWKQHYRDSTKETCAECGVNFERGGVFSESI